MDNKWTIIYHTADSNICPHIHKSFYEKSNPSANILFADGQDYYLPKPYSDHKVKDVNHGKKNNPDKWALHTVAGDKLRVILVRNHDKFLRDWLKDNFDKITTNNIAFFEWDVLLNKELPSINVKGFLVKKISNIDRHWSWIEDVKKFDEKINTGIVPFGTFYTNKDFVKQMIDSKYDYLYDQDLFCEARLTIMANFLNQNIVEYNEIFAGGENAQSETGANEGCFHPVKKEIKQVQL